MLTAALAAAAGALAALGCGGDARLPAGSRAALPLSALPEAEACAPCHASIVQKWLQHGMADALGPLVPARVPARLDGAWHAHTQSGARYRAESAERGGWRLAQEWSIAAPGLPPARREMPLRWRIGAGVQDMSFVAVEQGRWFFAPLEFLNARGWVPAPFQLTHGGGAGLDFRVTAECLGCHTDAPPPRAFPAHALGEFPARGISCAACHGASGEHVARMGEAALTGAAAAEPGILDPSDLPPERQLDLCARCHLEGDAQIEIAPPGAQPFRPGEDLLARRAVLVARAPGDAASFVSQVHRLSRSACFRASPEMTCTTCHDPHLPPRLQTRADSAAACSDCHRGLTHPEVPGSEGGDCIACHMPAIEPFDLPGARIADHWIRRRPQPPAPAGSFREHEAPDGDWEVFRYREQDPPHWSAAEVTALRAMAIAQQGRAAEAAPLFEEWSRSADAQSGAVARLPMLSLLRGIALAGTGDPRGAAAAYRRALVLDPDFAEARLNLATALVEAGDADAALVEIEPLLRSHPLADAPWLVAASAHAAAERTPEALAHLQRSLATFGAQPLALQRLGRAAAAAGETALARRALLGAWSLDPRLPGLAAEVRAILRAP